MKRSVKLFIQIISIFVFITVMLYSCKPKCQRHPDDPECAGENELITTIRIAFTDSISGASVGLFQFKDLDGNGIPEVVDTIRLSANKTYKAQLQFLNESVSPAVNISTEIEAEKNDHFILYKSLKVMVDFSYIDYDLNTPPLPVGLQTYWSIATPETGSVQITLRHQPGVKNGTANPGDTDAEVEFPIVVQ